MLDEDLLETLFSLYAPTGPERVGYVSGKNIIEFNNVHPDPEKFFEVGPEDIEVIEDDVNATAIWHSQPNKSSQLSYEDYVGFYSFPELLHVVIGFDGVRVYAVEDNAVLKKAFLRK